MDFKKHHSVVSNSLRPHGLYSPWNSPGQNTVVGSCSLLQGIFLTQGLNSGLPTLQADSLPAEPPGKPKDTAVDSLSLLQEIFLTQELNWGLLHCRWIFLPAELPGKLIQTHGRDSFLMHFHVSRILLRWRNKMFLFCRLQVGWLFRAKAGAAERL